MQSRLPWILLAWAGGMFLPAAEERAEIVTPSVLIEDLGDESYPVRVRASYELWELGADVRGLLEEAAENEDPEVSLRAGELLRKIQLGILPDSPAEVVALVERYDQASATERLEIIRELKELRAWRQVLKIHELETDPETLRRIAGEMAGVSVMAARDLLAEDEPNFKQAKELLELGRPEAAQLMALADFHRVRGTLDEELAKASKLQGVAGPLWRYVLHSAAGNRQAAAREAEAAGDPLAAARLRMLDGDPSGWLVHAPVPSGEIPPAALDAYRKAAAALWQGKGVSQPLVRELVSSIRTNFDDESWLSLGVLYALGEREKADPLLVNLSPTTAFLTFDSAERVDEAVEIFGIDPRNPDFHGWMEKRFKVLIDEPDEMEDELSEISQLAGFMERRGMHHELHEAMVGSLVELGKADPEWFMEVIGELGSRYSAAGAIRPVLAAAVEFGADDDARWRLIRDSIFGDSRYSDGLWESISTYDADLTQAEGVELMAKLLGRLPDDGEAKKWWEWQLEQTENGPKMERAERYGLLLAVSALNSDADLFMLLCDELKAAGFSLDDLGGYSDEFRFASFEVFCLGSVGRWDEVAAVWRRDVERNPANPMKQAYLAGALRRAGKLEEARIHDEMAERLALGDPRTMRSIGQAYASSVDFERAMEWWMRAATQSVEVDQEFYYSALLVANESKQQGDWKLAASLGEMYLLYQVMKGEVSDQPSAFSRGRLEVEMSRAFSRLQDDREQSVKTLTRCHQSGLTDGSMADFFFPGLREAGLNKLHDEWFEATWEAFSQVLKRYPKSHNTMNSLAWTAARANRRLTESKAIVEEALKLLPRQAAYLDTMGEIHFAQGNREKALEWSRRAVIRQPGDETLLRQFDRFESGPLPLD